MTDSGHFTVSRDGTVRGARLAVAGWRLTPRQANVSRILLERLTQMIHLLEKD